MQTPHIKLAHPAEAESAFGNFIVELLTRSVIVLSATLTLAAVATVV
jgi:hypothetical protein